jgi:hypothetical protein
VINYSFLDRLEWATTEANPRRPATGHDAGQTGWKLHAVHDLTKSVRDNKTVRLYGRALCGLYPRFGWGLDMFVEDRCKRCEHRVKLLTAKRLRCQTGTESPRSPTHP